MIASIGEARGVGSQAVGRSGDFAVGFRVPGKDRDLPRK